MPTARYRFTRDRDNVSAGLLSTNRPSTDARGALDKWAYQAHGRAYEVLLEKDDELVAVLWWGEPGEDANMSLDDACRETGVKRELLQSWT